MALSQGFIFYYNYMSVFGTHLYRGVLAFKRGQLLQSYIMTHARILKNNMFSMVVKDLCICYS